MCCVCLLGMTNIGDEKIVEALPPENADEDSGASLNCLCSRRMCGASHRCCSSTKVPFHQCSLEKRPNVNLWFIAQNISAPICVRVSKSQASIGIPLFRYSPPATSLRNHVQPASSSQDGNLRASDSKVDASSMEQASPPLFGDLALQVADSSR